MKCDDAAVARHVPIRIAPGDRRNQRSLHVRSRKSRRRDIRLWHQRRAGDPLARKQYQATKNESNEPAHDHFPFVAVWMSSPDLFGSAALSPQGCLIAMKEA